LDENAAEQDFQIGSSRDDRAALEPAARPSEAAEGRLEAVGYEQTLQAS
jgi:hypothetical protein